MRLLLLALLLAGACGHGDAALKEEEAKARHYRDAEQLPTVDSTRLSVPL